VCQPITTNPTCRAITNLSSTENIFEKRFSRLQEKTKIPFFSIATVGVGGKMVKTSETSEQGEKLKL
jgi:hypothetical protein